MTDRPVADRPVAGRLVADRLVADRLSPDPASILIVKLADFGDALLTTPALRALRSAYPSARLDVLTTLPSANVIRRSGLVDRVWTMDSRIAPRRLLSQLPGWPATVLKLRREGYAAIALLHRLTTRPGALKHAALVSLIGSPIRAGLRAPGRRRGWFLTHAALDRGFSEMHAVDAGLAVAAALGAPAAGLALAFEPGDEAHRAAQRLLADIAPDDFPDFDQNLPADRPMRVAIHPGGGPYSQARRWPPANFARVGDALADEGATILLVGRDGDHIGETLSVLASGAIDLTNQTDLPTLAAILKRVDLLITNDSGVMHLATAMGTRVVAVFGPSNPMAWGPWPGEAEPDYHRVVALDIPCRPCFYVGHKLGSPAGCPTRDCLRWLPADRVLGEARAALEAARSELAPSLRGEAQ